MSITKSSVEKMLMEGLTITEISEKLTQSVGLKVSENVLRAECKKWGLELRRKPTKKTQAVRSLFVDDTANLHKEVMGVPQLVEEVVVEKTVIPEPKGEVQVG